jgi:SAM-dependent methyltransferase
MLMEPTLPKALWDWNWSRDQDDSHWIAECIRRQRLDSAFYRRLSDRWPDASGVRVCELGAGAGRTGLALALHGARVTLVDLSPVALEKAARVAAVLGVDIELRQADILALPEDMLGRYDAAVSLGLVEHFEGDRRQQAIASHVQLVRAGGTIGVLVPNAACPFYRLWKVVAERRGWWSVGFERPFSRRELRAVCSRLPLGALRIEGSGFAYALNRFLLHKLYWGLRNLSVRGGLDGGGDRFAVPGWLGLSPIGGPLEHYLGYSLMLVATRSDAPLEIAHENGAPSFANGTPWAVA